MKVSSAFKSVVAQAVVQSLQSGDKKPPEVKVTTVDLDPDLEKLRKQGWVQHRIVGGSVLLGRVVADTIVENSTVRRSARRPALSRLGDSVQRPLQ